MLPVSMAFNEAARAGIRKPKAKVEICWTDPFIELSIEATATDTNRAAWIKQVADLIVETPKKWAHLDGQMKLDGTYFPMPGNEVEALDNQVGWWGLTACDATGNFSEPYPTLTITFTARPILAAMVSGDNQFNEFPVDFDVQVYHGETLLHTETVLGNTALKWNKDLSALEMYEADKMILIVKKWSTPNRIVKVTEFFSSIIETYTGDNIISFSITEELDVSNGSLPIGNISANEIDLKLANCDDKFFPGNDNSVLHALIKRNRRIKAWIGFELPSGLIEYTPMGVFWSGDWDARELDSYVSTNGRDRLELLRKTIYTHGSIYLNQSAYSLFHTILEDARLIMPDLRYSIDPELNSILIPTAYFLDKSYFECLQNLIQVCVGQLYCDRNGVLTILGPSAIATQIESAVPYEITSDDYYDRGQPAKSEELANHIEVTTSPLSTKREIVFRSDEPVSLDVNQTLPVSCKYDDFPVLNPIAHVIIPEANEGDPPNPDIEVTITNVSYFTSYAIVTVHNASGIKGVCEIFIKAVKLEEAYKSQEPILLTAGESKTITCKYSETPVINPVTSAEIPEPEEGEDPYPGKDDDLEITNAVYYAWGAIITVRNNQSESRYCNIVIKANKLYVQGQETITSEDAQSIKENGTLIYKFPDNYLLQSRNSASAISQQLLASYAIPRKDTELNWRGNPALVLTDAILVPEYKKNGIDNEGLFYITKQQFDFDGTLKSNLSGRKVVIVSNIQNVSNLVFENWQDSSDLTVIKYQSSANISPLQQTSTGNTYNEPGAKPVHITQINGPRAWLQSVLEPCQMGLETDFHCIGWKDETGAYHFLEVGAASSNELLTIKEGISEPETPAQGFMVIYSDGDNGNELSLKCSDGSIWAIPITMRRGPVE